MFTIHYLSWMWRLGGDSELFNKIIAKRNHKRIQSKYKRIIKSFNTYKNLFELSDVVICLSEDTYKILEKYYTKYIHKIHIIPNDLRKRKINISDVQKTAIYNRFHLDKNEKLLLFVGRLETLKGIYALLSALDI